MWKGVKGLLKVMKPKNPLSTSSNIEDDDVPTQWFEDSKANTEASNDNETDSDESQWF